jgi:hypothetical protein
VNPDRLARTTPPAFASSSAAEPPEALARRLRELDLYDHAAAIARCWHITLHDLIHSRRPPAPSARAAFYLHLRELGWSYPRIVRSLAETTRPS